MLWRKECLFVPLSILLKKMVSSANVTVMGRESVLRFQNANVSLMSWESYDFDDNAVFTWLLLLTAAVQL